MHLTFDRLAIHSDTVTWMAVHSMGSERPLFTSFIHRFDRVAEVGILLFSLFSLCIHTPPHEPLIKFYMRVC